MSRLSEFFARFTDISLTASEQRVELAGSSMTASRLATSRFVTVATPGYFDKARFVHGSGFALR